MMDVTHIKWLFNLIYISLYMFMVIGKLVDEFQAKLVNFDIFNQVLALKVNGPFLCSKISEMLGDLTNYFNILK
jgi:hypothetical protein